MPHSADCPEGRSQLFTFPRRELLQRLASAALLTIFPAHQSAAKLPAKYPVPSFRVGDKVSDHWIDEFGRDACELGEVIGICWEPHDETWGYHINWTGGTMPPEYYPCFDRHLTVGGDLRLVSHD